MRIFKRRTNKPTKQELESLIDYYDNLTAELPKGFALEKLDSPEKCHFLMLIKIADYYRPMGKANAILIAFKLGYLYGQGKIELGLPDYEDEESEVQ